MSPSSDEQALWEKSFIEYKESIKSKSKATSFKWQLYNTPIYPTIFLLNTRSLKANIDLILDLLIDDKPDIVLLTENWITSRDTYIFSCINNMNYCLTLLPRDNHRGGGVGILTRNSIVII